MFDPVLIGFLLAEMSAGGWVGIAVPALTAVVAGAGYVVKVTIPGVINRVVGTVDGIRTTFAAELRAERESRIAEVRAERDAHAARMDSLQKTFETVMQRHEESADRREAIWRAMVQRQEDGRNATSHQA